MPRSNASRTFVRLAASCLMLAACFGAYGSAHAQTTQTSPAGNVVSTQTNPAGATGQAIANPLKYNDLNSLLSAVLKAAIQLGSIILTLALVFVGFKFVAARGNEEAIRSARTALMWTVIGGLILLGATAIQAVITQTVSSISS